MPSYPKKIGKPKFGFTSGRKIDSSLPRQQTLYCPRDLGSITCVLFSEASERASVPPILSFSFGHSFFFIASIVPLALMKYYTLLSHVHNGKNVEWELRRKLHCSHGVKVLCVVFFLHKCTRTIRRSFFYKCIRCIANFVDKLSLAFINNNNGSMEAIKYAFPTWPA